MPLPGPLLSLGPLLDPPLDPLLDPLLDPPPLLEPLLEPLLLDPLLPSWAPAGEVAPAKTAMTRAVRSAVTTLNMLVTAEWRTISIPLPGATCRAPKFYPSLEDEAGASRRR